MEVLRRAAEQPVPHPRLTNRSIPADIETICLKCLEKEPAWRYPSAAALADDLDRFCAGHAIHARRAGLLTRSGKWMRRNPTSTLLVGALVALAAAVGWNIWKSELTRGPVTTGIAVLPFENLSEQKESGPFVDGVQDDILTKLAKIADLKVISRTSVMEYRGKRNVRQIGNALRVSHILEGSVRRSGTRLHMNTQLIDTRTDTHVWAEQYDGDVNDLFAIQSEITQKIAERLSAKISAAEKLAIEDKPTRDLIAFDLYSRANDIILETELGASKLADLMWAIDLLNQAVARDPAFLQAYCRLAFAHDFLYFNDVDLTPARLAMAEAAIQEAFRIRPNAGEAHFARAVHHYRGYRDYEGALAELEIAGQTLPNDARLFELKGLIQRRQGRWEESTRNLERAAELDPRNVGTLQEITVSYAMLRRYAEAKSCSARAVALAHPGDVLPKLELARWEFIEKADPRPLHQAIDSIRATNPAAITSRVAQTWLVCALAERDAAAAKEALNAVDDGDFWLGDAVLVNRAFLEGLIARMTNDEHKAQLAFAAARAQQKKVVQAQPDSYGAGCLLGMIDAALGRKEEALREGWRAVELRPMGKDAIDGKIAIQYLALIAAWVGEKDLACEQLAIAVRAPGPISFPYGSSLSHGFGGLKLMPWWDPLRGKPCFEKIVSSLAPR